MKSSSARLLATFALVLGATSAQAIPIVDTGASPFLGSGDPGISLNNLQHVAGRFTTTEDFEITSLSTFVRSYSCCGTVTNSFHIGLASGPDAPNMDSFTTFLSVPVSVTSEMSAANWVTGSVDNYLLTAGTWWIVAFGQLGDFPFGLGLPGGVPNPLDSYAYRSEDDGLWRTLEPNLGGTLIPATFGFRVEGNSLNVPEPGTLGLTAAGFLLMLGMRRRREVRAR